MSVERCGPQRLLGRGVWVCVNEMTDDWEKRKVVRVDVCWTMLKITDGIRVPYQHVYHVDAVDRGGGRHGYNAADVYLHSCDIPRRRLPDTPDARLLKARYLRYQKAYMQIAARLTELKMTLSCMYVKKPRGKR